MDEIRIDFTQKPDYGTVKKKKHRRNSSPREPVYQKRKQWWIDMGFGEQAADWAASWRLGLPEKTLELKEGDEVAIKNAIRTGRRRALAIENHMKNFYVTREEAIETLDKNIRKRDKKEKVQQALIEKDLELDSKKIESNIYKDESPD